MNIEKERLERVLELELPTAIERQIAELLEECFPNTFDGRTYFKQLPQLRLLLKKDGVLIGHLGLEHRIIRVADHVLRVVGVIDLCVAPASRRRGRASKLLRTAEAIARRAGAGYVILFADRTEIYLRNGYRPVIPSLVTWLAIDDRTSHGMMTRDFSGKLLVKSTSGAVFPHGSIDLLGYLF